MADLVGGIDLVVVVHGLLGHPRNVQRLACALVESGAHVHVSRATTGHTTGSIVACAERLAADVEEQLCRERVRTVSFVGFSLGGLHCRAALKPLAAVFRRMGVRPLLFASLATPNLGLVCRAGLVKSVLRAVPWPVMRELVLADGKDEEPLLYRMATDEEYLAPLRQFEARVVVGNACGDRTVPCSTATLRTRNPFAGSRGRRVELLTGTKSIAAERPASDDEGVPPRRPEGEPVTRAMLDGLVGSVGHWERVDVVLHGHINPHLAIVCFSGAPWHRSGSEAIAYVSNRLRGLLAAAQPQASATPTGQWSEPGTSANMNASVTDGWSASDARQ